MAANKGITELTSVKVISLLFGLVIIGATISISISVLPVYSLSLSSEGFKKFFELYDAPIKIATAYGVILGLISLNHRSIQTKEQLDRSSKQVEQIQAQNLFTNYYKHREEFVKYTEKIAKALECEPIDTAVLIHSNLFPYARFGDYAPYEITSTDFFENLAKLINECQTCIDESDEFNRVKTFSFTFPLSTAFNDLEILTGTGRSKDWKFNDTISLINFAKNVHFMASIFYLFLTDYWVIARFEKNIQTTETRDITRALGDFKANFKCNDELNVSLQIKPYLQNITRAISKLN
jgi:hypothetical protein